MSKADKTKDEDETKGGVGEFVSTILWAIGIMLVVRIFLLEPFTIPSGSMVPTLTKGDYIITSKFTVGYGKYSAMPLPFPVQKGRLFEHDLKRGDVIVFRPEGDNKNFVKRLVGLPGDQIQMKEGRLFLNGEQVPVAENGAFDYNDSRGNIEVSELLTETFPGGHAHQILDAQKDSPLDRTDIRTVPAGYYFMMGDNRDHSYDSRVTVADGGAGIVPKENIIGRAEIILLSVDDDFAIFKPWTWLNVRGDRWFKDIK